MKYLSRLKLGNYFRAAFDLVLPRVCVVCGRPLNLQESHICLPCEMNFPYTHFELTRHNRMADFYNERLSQIMPDDYMPYQWAIALMRYQSGSMYSHIPWALKYNGNIPVGKYIAERLFYTIRRTPWLADVDMIIPVPVHRRRRFRRGYNQAEVIAFRLGALWRIKVNKHFLRKKKYTISQVKVDTTLRHANISGSFEVVQRYIGEFAQVKHILLVDDVFTTGSTLAECHKTIRTALKRTIRISVATIACVE